jgi:hypothetical protein
MPEPVTLGKASLKLLSGNGIIDGENNFILNMED